MLLQCCIQNLLNKLIREYEIHTKGYFIQTIFSVKFQIINLMTRALNYNENGFPLYHRISSASGGLTTVTTRSQISDVSRLFETLTAQGQVSKPTYILSKLGYLETPVL